MITKIFGDNLKKARDSKDLKQDELGKLVGVGYQRISAYENGADISLEMVGKLADALGIEPWELIKPGSLNETPLDNDVMNLLANTRPEHLKFINEAIRRYFKGVKTTQDAFLAAKDIKDPK